jgi:mono/diheme cytochrome c family protein
MSPRRALAAVGLVALAACGRVPLDKAARDDAQAAAPVTWQGLYAANCAACHGADGTMGAARPLRDATYLVSVPREHLIAATAAGQGTLMPAFAQSKGGGMPDAQVVQLVDGMLAEWAKGGVPTSVAWSGALGDAGAGAATYATHCQTCHGAPDGRDTGTRGSVTDPNYLRLVSDQALRSAVLFGRADLGAACNGPYPGQAAGRTLSATEVADVTAFLAARRPNFGGKR